VVILDHPALPPDLELSEVPANGIVLVRRDWDFASLPPCAEAVAQTPTGPIGADLRTG
jgi:hypothetical protein